MMRIFYAFLVLLQLFLALLCRNQNQVTYLMYLWSDQVSNNKYTGHRNALSGARSNYRETKSEIANSEYALLLER